MTKTPFLIRSGSKILRMGLAFPRKLVDPHTFGSAIRKLTGRFEKRFRMCPIWTESTTRMMQLAGSSCNNDANLWVPCLDKAYIVGLDFLLIVRNLWNQLKTSSWKEHIVIRKWLSIETLILLIKHEFLTCLSIYFHADECSDNPCKNSAACIDLHADYICSCLPGYTGKNCDIGKPGFVSSFIVISSVMGIKDLCLE